MAIVQTSMGQSPFEQPTYRQQSPGEKAKPEHVIPVVVRGAWFSREKNVNTFTEFDDKSMSTRGYLIDIKEEFHVNVIAHLHHQSSPTVIIRLLINPLSFVVF